MEGLSPPMLLLQESKKVQEFRLKSANEQFCDWLNFDQIDGSLPDDKPCVNTRQVSSNNTNKCSNYRRYPPCSNWTKSLKNLDIKFEHFTESSYYIEQYRRAKQLRIEDRLAKLMQRNEKTVSCQKGGSFADRSVHSSESTTGQNSVHPKQGQHSLQAGVKQSGDTVKPSLPQSGYFAGRKWVYPKDFARVCSKNIGVKCGSPRTQLKRTDKQTHHTNTKMCLQGTGKPLNISCNKGGWTVPRHRSACKSAPACRQNQPNHTQTGPWSNTQTKPIRSPAQSKSLTCADLSLLLQKHSITQPKSSLQTTPVCNAYDRVKSPKTSVDSKSFGDKVEYEKIFRNVFEFYEQNSDARSHVYINT